MGAGGSISVIVVSYNTGPALWNCLQRLLQQQGVLEVIVVNNGNPASVEDHLARLEQHYSRLKLVSKHGNIGFARGCNLGVSHAMGDHVVFLNPDAILLEENALLQLTSLLDERVWLVGGILRNDDGSEQRGSRRNLMSPQNALSDTLRLGRILPSVFPRLNLHDTPLPDVPSPVPAVSGACMAMERARFESLQGFDGEYFLHVEDMDLCTRIRDAGGEVWVHPKVNILHYLSTSRVSTLFVERNKAFGFVRYFRDHYPHKPVWSLLGQAAAMLHLGLKTFFSLCMELFPIPQLATPVGVRRVMAIAKGMEMAAQESHTEEGRLHLPTGSCVLVTGASTAVGLYAIGHLLGMGCRVIAATHKTYIGFYHPQLTWIKGDFATPETLVDALAELHNPCRFAIHAAPIWHLPGIMPILSAAGIRHVSAISSTSLISKEKSKDPKERRVVQQLAKGEEETRRLAEELYIDYTLFRPTMIYGAGLDQNITRIAHMIDHYRLFFIQAPAMGKRVPVHADDVAKAALRALTEPVAYGKTYTVCGGEVLPYRAIPQRIARHLNMRVRIIGIPGLSALCQGMHLLFPRYVPHAEMALRMQRDLVFDDSGIRRDLHIMPQAFLTRGAADIGECDEESCRFLLPLPNTSKTL